MKIKEWIGNHQPELLLFLVIIMIIVIVLLNFVFKIPMVFEGDCYNCTLTGG